MDHEWVRGSLGVLCFAAVGLLVSLGMEGSELGGVLRGTSALVGLIALATLGVGLIGKKGP